MDDETATARGFALSRWPWTLFWTCASLLVVFGGMSYVFGWCSEAAAVTQNELGASALLRKYTWFKDAAAQLEKKQADIRVYEQRMTAMADGYKVLPRQQWPRDDREQYNLWSTEVAGVKASYNDLAAQYNAKMAEINWRFTNVGSLPAGATEPLQREFAPYVDR